MTSYLEKINEIESTTDTLENSNITLNNSSKITFTSSNGTNSNSYHANAAIWLKDSVLSGAENSNLIIWQKIQAADNDLTFNNSIVITEYNAGDILSNVYLNEPSNVSNIIIHGNYTGNAYINFINGPNRNQGPIGVGFRYNSNEEKVQFTNNGATWFNLTTYMGYLDELADVEINNLYNNQYLKWDQSSNLWINSNLSINDDSSPSLGGNLALNNYSLISNGLTIFNTSGDKVIEFNDVGSTAANYLIFNNSNSGSDPVITVEGSDSDIGIELNTKGDGNLIINTDSGNTYINSQFLEISGFQKGSIYRTSSNTSYTPASNWSIPISSDFIMFDFYTGNTVGTYWANIGAGIEGQKLNLSFFNSNNSGGITVLSDFGNNGLSSGNGLATKIKMNKSGQGASLVYFGPPQNVWQIINTGAQIL
jgi:hypothetical protein